MRATSLVVLVLTGLSKTALAVEEKSNSTNSLPLNGGPVLYYNGSGSVPPYPTKGPDATPLQHQSSKEVEDALFHELQAIRTAPSFASDNCTQYIATQEVLHIAALTQTAELVTNLLVRLCEAGSWKPRLRNSASNCVDQFSGKANIGPFWAQMLAKMSVGTGDMQVFCAYQYGQCKPPETILIDESQWFSPKPKKQLIAPKPSGKTFKVIHLTDSHLDQRYDIGSEASCSQYLCCRPYSTNTLLKTTSANASLPASRFGHPHCDPPADLILSTFLDMPKLTNMNDVQFAIFTGDAVSHDNDDQLSREYVEYEEEVTYRTMKAQLGRIPVFPTLGNHDSLPQAYEMPNSLLPGGSDMSWNHKLVSSMWHDEGWIGANEASNAATHYGAYATTTKQGLRVIALNTEFWYIDNVYNYINYTNPDTSGMLSFLIQELEAAEKQGQRAWIIGHVPTGYDYFSPLPNPTALFYAIVRRFSPATIAGIFFGHTHQDQFNVYYDFKPESLVSGSRLRNTTNVDYSKPLNVAYMGPSISPLTGYNAGWRIYEVDETTFDVINHESYIADLSLSSDWTTTPIWTFEYSAREIYDPENKWPSAGKKCSGRGAAPLNATFWDNVAKQMQTNLTLSAKFGSLESKSSVLTKPCNTTACAENKVCSIRSASGGLLNNCPGVVAYLFDGPLGGTR